MLHLIETTAVLSLLAIWLATFASLSEALPNFAAHAHERLYAWELYNLNIEVLSIESENGAELNKDILKFVDKRGYGGGGNRGSGDRGQLTYNEFMNRVNGVNVGGNSDPGRMKTFEKDPAAKGGPWKQLRKS